MLQRKSAKVAARVDVEQRVLVELTGLDDIRRADLDVKRIGVLKVSDFHGL
jgi:hypothetical protein